MPSDSLTLSRTHYIKALACFRAILSQVLCTDHGLVTEQLRYWQPLYVLRQMYMSVYHST